MCTASITSLRRSAAGDGEHLRVNIADEIAVLLGAQTTGHDHLCFSASASPMASSDSATASSMKPQGVDNDQSSISIVANGGVPLGLQARAPVRYRRGLSGNRGDEAYFWRCCLCLQRLCAHAELVGFRARDE